MERNLVTLTWGNVSAITLDRQHVIIKPSGVDYSTMVPEKMVVVDLDGNLVEGNLRPSSDLPTHLELHKAWEGVNSVVHTHFRYATVIAQAELDLSCYSTDPCRQVLRDNTLHSSADNSGN